MAKCVPIGAIYGQKAGPRLMNGMATYHAVREGAAERHIATLALLNGVAGIVLALLAGWIIWSARGATEDDEVLLRLAVGATCLGLTLLNAGLSYGLQRFSSTARVIQIVVASLMVPLFPIGTVWGGYALWALVRRKGKAVFTSEAAFRRREVARRPPQPYYGAVMIAVTVGVGLVTFSLLKSHELWLARKVRIAALHEASQRAAVDRSMQRLRDLSVDDLAESRVRAADLPPAIDGAEDGGSTQRSSAQQGQK
jgi:hypothetical protein